MEEKNLLLEAERRWVEQDPNAATRHAIVRAAAAIGENL